MEVVQKCCTRGFSSGRPSFREVVPAGRDHRRQQDPPKYSGTLGLVVDAAPCDAGAMSEGLLAALIKDDDTEVEEAATPYDQDSLLERAFMTGWKCYEEGERDIDELVAAVVEAIEGDVTDHDMCMDLIQTIEEVFDQAVFLEDRKC